MLNNNPNPLRAAYPELDGRTAIEALRGAGIYVGPGPVPDWAKVQLDPTGGDVVTTAAGIACTPPAGMPGVTDMQKAVDALVPYEVGTWTPTLVSGAASAVIYGTSEYYKIGKLVHLTAFLYIELTEPNESAFRFTIPFACGGIREYGMMGYNTTGKPNTRIDMSRPEAYANISYDNGGAGSGIITGSDLGTKTKIIQFAATYITI